MATRTSIGSPASVPLGLRAGAAAGVLLVALVAAALLSYQVAYAGKVYPGVEVMGVDLGGRTPAEAQALLEERFNQYSRSPLTLRYGDRLWRMTPADLGFSLDAAETARLSYMTGRQGSVVERLGDELGALAGGRVVEPALSFDDARASAVLAKLSEEIQHAPSDAALVVGADGTVQIAPAKTGLALDLPRSLAQTRAAVLALSTADIELATVGQPAAVGEGDLATAREAAEKLIGRPVTLVAGGRTWTLTSKDLASLVAVTPRGSSVDVRLDEAKLTAYLEGIAKEVARPGGDARLRVNGTKVEVVPGTDGEELDVTSSRAMILARIGDGSAIPLVLKKTPGLPASALEETRARLESLLKGPTEFKYGDRSYQLQAEEIAGMLVITDGPPGQPPAVTLDAGKMTAFVERLAKQVNREPQDARFRVQGGQVVLVADAVDGIKVDVPATVEAANVILTNPAAVVPIKVKATKPAVTAAALGQIVLRDLIMEATTSYAGAIPAKVHNIQLAASRLNGVAIPPGATFSFNRALGPATIASGFQIGYGIAVNGAGQMETVPSEAGGICQVATTLFHSVFWAGYPIVERNWHMYWIPKYGQPPRGLKGLDATVDDQYGVDFQFKNNTPNWIAIEASASGNTLRFALRGIKPDWKVSVGQPKITNVVPANRETVRQPDPTLPAGQTLWVEAAEDGFDVAIDRTVTRGDQVVDQWTARAHYRPSRNVLLVGTKGATPTATPSASPSAAPTTTGAPAPATPGTPAPAATPAPTGTPAPAATKPAAATPAPPTATPRPATSPTKAP